jgi:hypothetical protein
MHDALLAAGMARPADFPAVVNQQVVGLSTGPRREDSHQLSFCLLDITGPCQAQTVGHPEDMGIDGNDILVEGAGQDYVGHLSPHPGESH